MREFLGQMIVLGEVNIFDNDSKKIVEINSILAEWQDVLQRIEFYLKNHKYICKENAWGVIYNDKMLELTEFEEEYNDLVSRTLSLLTKLQLDGNVLPRRIMFKRVEYKSYSDERGIPVHICVNTLNRMKKQAKAMVKLLSDLINMLRAKSASEIPPKYIGDLLSLEKEINKLPSDLIIYVEDAKKALNHFRKGCFLGSVMIAGRIIDVIIDKIRRKLGGGGDLEEVLKKFLEIKLLKNLSMH